MKYAVKEKEQEALCLMSYLSNTPTKGLNKGFLQIPFLLDQIDWVSLLYYVNFFNSIYTFSERFSYFSSCARIQAANEAVKVLIIATPKIMRTAATSLPSVVTGNLSPYPIVVIVTKPHQRASIGV